MEPGRDGQEGIAIGRPGAVLQGGRRIAYAIEEHNVESRGVVLVVPVLERHERAVAQDRSVGGGERLTGTGRARRVDADLGDALDEPRIGGEVGRWAVRATQH